MSERLHNIKIGDTVRVFTYKGVCLGGHSKIPNIVDERYLGEKNLAPLDPNEDGFRFVGIYLGMEEMRSARGSEPFFSLDDIRSGKGKEPFVKMQVLSQNVPKRDWNWGQPNSNDPDLVIPERLVRRYQILESTYSSDVLPLEEPNRLEALAS